MPELPEVETVVRDLRAGLVGRLFVTVRRGRKKLRVSGMLTPRPREHGTLQVLVGRSVEAVGRRGKWIIIEVPPGRLLVHLGMTGQLTVVPGDRPVERHTHLVIDLDDGRRLRFRDE